MSTRYTYVKSYYDKGLWKKWQVADAVLYGWITKEEYELITGEVYPEGHVKGQDDV